MLIGSNVTAIGAAAFSCCTSLSKITLPTSLAAIEDYLFAGSGLTDVSITDCVASVGSHAFEGCYSLVTVTLGEGVTNIGTSAFSDCSCLSDVLIGSNVTAIGTAAFSRCTSLSGITIGASVSVIEQNAFYGCTGIDSIIFLGDAPMCGTAPFQDISGIAYRTSVSTGWPEDVPGAEEYWNGVPLRGWSITELSIEPSWIVLDTVNTTDASVVITNSGLAQAPAWLDDAAFGQMGFTVTSQEPWLHIVSGGCGTNSGLALIRADTDFFDSERVGTITVASVSASNSRMTIPVQQRPSGWPLRVTATNGAITIHGLYPHDGSSEIVIPASIDGMPVTDIGDNAFRGLSSLTSVTIPPGVTNIGSEAFAYCDSLTDITIPDSVISIGEQVFYGCERLMVLSLGEGVSTIGSEAFYGCHALWDLVIPDSVTIIENSAFEACISLWRVSIGRGVTYIGDSAFAGCGTLFDLFLLGDAPGCGTEPFQGVPGIVYRSVDTFGWPEDVPGEEEYWNGMPVRILGTAYLSISPSDLLATPAGGTFSFAVTNTGSGTMEYWAESYDTSWLRITAGFSGTDSGIVDIWVAENITGNTRTGTVGVASLIATNSPFFLKVVQRSVGWPFRYTVVDDVAIITGIQPDFAESDCSIPTSIAGIPVNAIGDEAFANCATLTHIIIPDCVVRVGADAFANCGNLKSIFFCGNPPSVDHGTCGTEATVVCHPPQVEGWNDTFAGRPVVVWNATVAPFSLNRNESGFGFAIIGTANIPVVVEAVGDLRAGLWQRVWTGHTGSGTILFRDTESCATQCFYRVVWP